MPASVTNANVLIVGSGPGGGATAVRLAQLGVPDVMLVDRDRFPRDKTCGSGISPNCVTVLEELGLGDEVRERGYMIHTLRLVTPGNREMLLTGDLQAFILLRKHFDNLLNERAQKLGVGFRGGWRANHLLRDASGRAYGVRSLDGDEIHANYVICADGAHSIFSWDPRPKRTISTLMGWWENVPFREHTVEMVFDKGVSPLYGWLFPETATRVNIGICIDGQDDEGNKSSRPLRQVFQKFVDDQYADRLKNARQIGKLRGHPISYTTWVRDITGPGAIYIGEGARITHNATGEGIYQAIQSGVYGADCVADILAGRKSETAAQQRYITACRERFTMSFLVGHALRGLVRTPVLDWCAMAYNNPSVRAMFARLVGSALAGQQMTSRDAASFEAPRTHTNGTAHRDGSRAAAFGSSLPA
jgi:flavin-dependent dehydrogenase